MITSSHSQHGSRPNYGDSRSSRASSTSGLSLRLATTSEEREEIYRLRHEVYGIENHFGAQASADFRAWEDSCDAKAAHLYAAADGKIVGALRILYGADGAFSESSSRAYDLGRFLPIVALEKMAITSRFALKREYRASTLAIQLFIESARLQRERGIELAFGDSPLTLLPYYTALGFRTYQAPYHHPVAGTLAPFVFVVGDLEYLRQIQSPILTLATESTSELDETARRMREVLSFQTPLRGARSHTNRFWMELYRVFGQPPFENGPLAGLTEAELRSLLGSSYIADFPGGSTLLRTGHPATERWLVLSGQVEVDDMRVPPYAIVGGASEESGALHGVDARIGSQGAMLVSIDERKLRQMLGTASHFAERLSANLEAFQIRAPR